MKSITIHNLDDSLALLIQEKARKEGLSLNRAVKLLLCEALGLSPTSSVDRKADFAEFCGVWSESDQQEFEAKIKDLRQVDGSDWQ